MFSYPKLHFSVPRSVTAWIPAATTEGDMWLGPLKKPILWHLTVVLTATWKASSWGCVYLTWRSCLHCQASDETGSCCDLAIQLLGWPYQLGQTRLGKNSKENQVKETPVSSLEKVQQIRFLERRVPHAGTALQQPSWGWVFTFHLWLTWGHAGSTRHTWTWERTGPYWLTWLWDLCVHLLPSRNQRGCAEQALWHVSRKQH
jgi:hypothetical protein